MDSLSSLNLVSWTSRVLHFPWVMAAALLIFCLLYIINVNKYKQRVLTSPKDFNFPLNYLMELSSINLWT